MKRKFETKQSSETSLGCCYGYSSFWAQGKLNLDNLGKNGEIPLNDDIRQEHWSQLCPSTSHRLSKFYIDYWDREEYIKDVKEHLQEVGDAVLIGYFGAGLGDGHSLALKKIGEDRYEYFDSEAGVWEFEGEYLDKLFSHVIPKDYQSKFYGLTLNYISAAEPSPDLQKNLWAVAYTTACVWITTPIGVVRYLESFSKLIVKLVSEKLKSTSEKTQQTKPNESTSLLTPTIEDKDELDSYLPLEMRMMR